MHTQTHAHTHTLSLQFFFIKNKTKAKPETVTSPPLCNEQVRVGALAGVARHLGNYTSRISSAVPPQRSR